MRVPRWNSRILRSHALRAGKARTGNPASPVKDRITIPASEPGFSFEATMQIEIDPDVRRRVRQEQGSRACQRGRRVRPGLRSKMHQDLLS